MLFQLGPDQVDLGCEGNLGGLLLGSNVPTFRNPFDCRCSMELAYLKLVDLLVIVELGQANQLVALLGPLVQAVSSFSPPN
jgi:hypothetical protein